MPVQVRVHGDASFVVRRGGAGLPTTIYEHPIRWEVTPTAGTFGVLVQRIQRDAKIKLTYAEAERLGITEDYVRQLYNQDLPQRNTDKLRITMAKYGSNRWWEGSDIAKAALFQLFESVKLLDHEMFTAGLTELLQRDHGMITGEAMRARLASEAKEA